MTETVSVDDFISDTIKDIESPSESEFISKISSIRQTIYSLDEVQTQALLLYAYIESRC